MALRAILDTRFYFSYYSPESRKVADWSRELVHKAVRGELPLASSTVTIAELYATMGRRLGIEAVRMRIASMKASNIGLIPVTEDVASLAGRISLRAPSVPLADALIAATARIHSNGVVVTDDEHFGLIEGIKARWMAKV
ncbi:TPA: PIN domain-containing protein [Candidatus Bathyarchaeota archaeon]|nr:PIN domain-containing protein [Candidatus Bathyarchaeota archaeon]